MKCFESPFVVLVAALATLSGAVLSEAAISYYVATDGNDSNPGTQTEPFLTLERVRNEVRTIPKDQPITIYLMPGDYLITSTLRFNEQDSGAPGNPVTYAAYGEPGSARLISGMEVTEWTDEGDGIYSAAIPHFVHAVFENGVAGVVSREPDPGEGEAPIGTNLLAGSSSLRSIEYRAGQYTEFDYTDVVINVWPLNWLLNRFPVSDINFETREISFNRNMGTNPKPNTRFFLEHARAFIDEPGEFYVQEATNTLYYMPRDTPIEEQVIRIPRLKRLIQISGASASNRVHDIRLQGLAVAEVDSNIPGNTAWSRGIYIYNADSIHFDSMRFDNAGDDGVFIWESSYDISIVNSAFSNCRVGGVQAYSTTPQNSFVDQQTPLVYDISNVTISNCAFWNMGRRAILFRGVEYADIGYNEIQGCPMAGIQLQVASQTNIHHNNIHEVAYNFKDIACGIYSNSNGRNITIDNNRIYDVRVLDHWEGAGGKAIYLDLDANVDVDVTNNVIFDVEPGTKTIKLGGERILLHNNIIDNRGNRGRQAKVAFWGGSHSIIWVSWMSDEIVWDRDMSFSNNVFLNDNPDDGDFILFQNGSHMGSQAIYLGNAEETLQSSDNNLFYNPAVDLSEYEIAGYPIDSWQTLGGKNFDANSLFHVDPLFEDPDAKDYRFKAGSPALALGTIEPDAATAAGVGPDENNPYRELIPPDAEDAEEEIREILVGEDFTGTYPDWYVIDQFGADESPLSGFNSGLTWSGHVLNDEPDNWSGHGLRTGKTTHSCLQFRDKQGSNGAYVYTTFDAVDMSVPVSKGRLAIFQQASTSSIGVALLISDGVAWYRSGAVRVFNAGWDSGHELAYTYDIDFSGETWISMQNTSDLNELDAGGDLDIVDGDPGIPDLSSIQGMGTIIVDEGNPVAAFALAGIYLLGPVGEERWAFWPKTGDDVYTGDWLGWLNVQFGDWVWSYTLSSWLYLPEGNVSESGTWVYFLKGINMSGPVVVEMWAFWPKTGDDVYTGDWLGWLNVEFGDWVWCYSLNSWIYLPEGNVTETGAWAYFPSLE